MFAPVALRFQRSLADFPVTGEMRLVVGADLDRVTDTKDAPENNAFLVQSDPTPSPEGQHNGPPPVLPVFSERCGSDDFGQDHSGRAEPNQICRVNPVDKSSKGTGRCLSKTLFSVFLPVVALPPVVTRLANRPWAARPSVQVQRQSPAAALFRARPSVWRAMSPIASSTPENVTDPSLTFPVAAGRSNRRGAVMFHPYCDPAQPVLQRGLCVFPKTQKDVPCSRNC
jgi:hypothetical protein